MIVGMTPVLLHSYLIFIGKTLSVIPATAYRTRSNVVDGGIPFSASQRIGFGGFSSFFFGGGFFAAFLALSPFLSFLSFGMSLPNVTRIGSSFFPDLVGSGLACTYGTPGIMGKSESKVLRIVSKSIQKLSSSNCLRSKNAIKAFCYSSISSSSSLSTSSS